MITLKFIKNDVMGYPIYEDSDGNRVGYRVLSEEYYYLDTQRVIAEPVKIVFPKKDYSKKKRTWRTLVRVESVSEKQISVTIPAWNHGRVVTFPKRILPAELRKRLAKTGIQGDFKYFYVKADIDASSVDQLVDSFEQFEDKST
jgi:hypothetical protein